MINVPLVASDPAEGMTNTTIFFQNSSISMILYEFDSWASIIISGIIWMPAVQKSCYSSCQISQNLIIVSLSLIWHRLGYLIVDNTLFVNHQPKIKNCLFELFSFIKINAINLDNCFNHSGPQ